MKSLGDHADDFATIGAEVVRVLKPGGLFIGSFNLGEPPAPCEPQSLSETMVKEHLLAHMEVESYQLTAARQGGRKYEPLMTGEVIPPKEGEIAVLWVRARKKPE